MKPGSTQPPSASSTACPFGIRARGPSAEMCPSVMTMVPSNGSPVMGTMWAPVIATFMPHRL
jgi:hypothetical protein